MTQPPRVVLLPEGEAVVGRVSYGAPTFDPTACGGCAGGTACRSRGSAKAFEVLEVRDRRIACSLTGGYLVPCRAEHRPQQEQPVLLTRRETGARRWLVDANVFFAANNASSAAGRFLRSRNVLSVTTRQVRDELVGGWFEPEDLEVRLATILPDVRQMGEFARDDLGKEPSEADLSLVQALVDDSTLAGIVSSDGDIHRMHPQSWIRKTQERHVRVLRPEEVVP